MEESVVDNFAQHVKLAAQQVADQVPNEFPRFTEDAQMVAQTIMSVFAVPDFMHAFDRWMMIGSFIHSAAQCDCGDHERHAFLGRCDQIMVGHTMSWQVDHMRSFLTNLGLDTNVVNIVVEAFANKMAASITKVDKVEVPDYVPSDWDKNDSAGD